MAEIVLKHSVESSEGTDRVLFELTIPSEQAPSGKSQRIFSIFHHAPPVQGKPRPAPKKLQSTAIGMSNVAVSEVDKPPPPLADDPLLPRWHVTAAPSSFLGELIFRGEWQAKSDGQTHQFEERVPAGTELGKDPVDIFLKTAIPQIGVRINEVTPQVVASSATDEAGKAVEVMQHVQRLLDEGLEPVWSSIEGLPTRNGKPLMAASPDDFTDEELEECWAQLLSERLVGTPYAGPGVNHFGDAQKGDIDLFSKAFDSVDPAYPIIYACQHLCTAAAVSRGIQDAADKPIDARSAENERGGGILREIWTTDQKIEVQSKALPTASLNPVRRTSRATSRMSPSCSEYSKPDACS